MEQTSNPGKAGAALCAGQAVLPWAKPLAWAEFTFAHAFYIPGVPAKSRFAGHCSMAIITAALADN